MNDGGLKDGGLKVNEPRLTPERVLQLGRTGLRNHYEKGGITYDNLLIRLRPADGETDEKYTSNQGWIGLKEDLIDTVELDAKALQIAEVGYGDIVQTLQKVQEITDASPEQVIEFTIGKKQYKAKRLGTRQEWPIFVPFPDSSTRSKIKYSVSSEETKDSLGFTGVHAELIDKYYFFEGLGAPSFRLSPLNYLAVFEPEKLAIHREEIEALYIEPLKEVIATLIPQRKYLSAKTTDENAFHSRYAMSTLNVLLQTTIMDFHSPQGEKCIEEVFQDLIGQFNKPNTKAACLYRCFEDSLYYLAHYHKPEFCKRIFDQLTQNDEEMRKDEQVQYHTSLTSQIKTLEAKLV